MGIQARHAASSLAGVNGRAVSVAQSDTLSFLCLFWGLVPLLFADKKLKPQIAAVAELRIGAWDLGGQFRGRVGRLSGDVMSSQSGAVALPALNPRAPSP